jgi:hypothetical protein
MRKTNESIVGRLIAREMAINNFASPIPIRNTRTPSIEATIANKSTRGDAIPETILMAPTQYITKMR